jgi:dihydrofolate reductase
MRKVVADLFISLDGIPEAPDKWQFEFDGVMEAHLAARLLEADAVLLGRVTYDEWAPYWPTAEHEPFATYINNTQKYVFSKTLDKVEWQNSILVKGDLVQEIAKLKAQPGKNISTEGSPSIVRALIAADLLDELSLVVHPAIAGQGKSLWAEADHIKRLTLLSSKTTPSGCVISTYRRYEG